MSADNEVAAENTDGKLLLYLDGFEGSIDLLLALAREQKVDLAKISILALVEQYLAFIEEVRKIRLEVAADWLVMAAWLAWIKSRWLLPEPEPIEKPERAMVEQALTFQLRRLEAMQQAAQNLLALPHLGEDNFSRGVCEIIPVDIEPVWHLPLSDLLNALAASLRRRKPTGWTVNPSSLCALHDSLEHLRGFVRSVSGWINLETFWPVYSETRKKSINKNERELINRSVAASSFAAILEMAKEGEIDLRQENAFSDIWMKTRDAT